MASVTPTLKQSSAAPHLEIIQEAVRQQELQLSSLNQRAQSLDARATGLLTVFGTSGIVILGVVASMNDRLAAVTTLQSAGIVLACGLAVAAMCAAFSTIRLKFFLPGFMWKELHPVSGMPLNQFLFHVAYALDKRIEYNVERLSWAARWQWLSAVTALLSLGLAVYTAIPIDFWRNAGTLLQR